MPWHILTTAPQAELYVRNRLIDAGLGALVPVRTTVRNQPTREGKRVHRPLLPGYVFAHMEAPDWRLLRGISGYRGMLVIAGQPASLPQPAVDALEKLSSIEIIGAPTGRRLKPGDLVNIRKGPFAMLQATVTALVGRGRFVGMVEMFGRRNEVVLSIDDVHPV